MNGRVAKALRREVYGEASIRGKREYLPVATKRWHRPTTQRVNAPGSLRAAYQDAKRRIRARRVGGPR